MEIRHHSPYRLTARPSRVVVDGAPEKVPNIAVWALDMVRGHGDEADFPDVSGFAPLDEERLLAARDTKPFHFGSSVLGTVTKENGQYQGLDIDWSQTGKPFDLEAVAATDRPGHYLAVEGSRSLGRTPKLFEIEITSDKARSLNSHPLPKLNQEIEGMLYHGNKLILAGRGSGSEQPELYWGDFSDQGLSFTQAGQQGVPLPAPSLASEQRGLTELVADQDGYLWASATATVGELGDYRSAIYQLGRLGDGEQPFELQTGEAFFVDGPKIEALHIDSDKFYLGSDNESLKGRLDIVTKDTPS